MAKLKKASHTNLSNKQIASLARSTYTLTEQLDAEPNMKNLRAVLVKPLDEINRAFTRELKSSYTAHLAQLDYNRDQILVAIHSHCVAAIDQYMIDQTKADQAKVVQGLERKLPSNLIKLGYQEESTHILAFLDGAKEIAGAIEESGAEPLFLALGKAQREFDEYYIAKITSEEFADAPRRTKAIRQDITTAINGLFEYINSVAQFNPVQYESIITSLNTVTAEYTAKSEAAKSRAATIAAS